MALNDFKDVNQEGGVLTVSNSNMGKGIKWNPITKQYEVNIGDGLEINEQGQVVAKKIEANPVTTQMVDNGSATVIGQTYTIDYGNGLIEVNGIMTFPLATVINRDTTPDARYVNGFFVGCADAPTPYLNTETLYHKETRRSITAKSLGMKSILNVNAIPMDISGYRTETVWLVNRELFSDSIILGIHTLASLDQGSINVMFQIKGIKA